MPLSFRYLQEVRTTIIVFHYNIFPYRIFLQKSRFLLSLFFCLSKFTVNKMSSREPLTHFPTYGSIAPFNMAITTRVMAKRRLSNFADNIDTPVGLPQVDINVFI